ncbi:Phosphatidate cytidylyltransferase [Liberibacter crescens BT-1]|uniref:Phosphatidate cytidylyltransferase n=1 Tax=Liberibacter crescens (strain BT-1) TaxID=1215343 RepID=L0ETT2_LIBCB|nr:CDP-archaeol synthase [Liberibacter crescens]AGA64038.1 Phosphatidate cytidylyltransferase [Liberibacter crescens BT-1]
MNIHELKLRIASGILIGLVFLFSAWCGGWIFRSVAVLVSVLIYSEWSSITCSSSEGSIKKIFGWCSIILISSMVFLGFLKVALLIFFLYFIAFFLLFVMKKVGFWYSLGIFYSEIFAITVIYLRGNGFEGFSFIIFIFSVVWATDVFAYFFGRFFGGPKLAKRFSPGKTWSGAIGGLLFGVMSGIVVSHFIFPGQFNRAIMLATTISIASQLGDLCESLIKRRFDVKQSGWLIPGHGGIMDRMDCLVFASLVVSVISFFE